VRREAAGGLFRLARRADLIRPMRRAKRGKSPMGCGAEPHVSVYSGCVQSISERLVYVLLLLAVIGVFVGYSASNNC